MMIITIELNDIVTRLENLRFQKPINWVFDNSQNWVLIGENGAGKSLLIDILRGKHALIPTCKVVCRDENNAELKIRDVLKCVSFNDIYSIVDTNNSYYQQRWNKGIENDVAVTKVYELLTENEKNQLDDICRFFDIEELLEKEVTLLSSGELRKFLVIRSILSRPRILILDNPYIGLDTDSRLVLSELFNHLSAQGIAIILLVADPIDIPSCITHVLTLKNKDILGQFTIEEFKQQYNQLNLFNNYAVDVKSINSSIEANYEIVTKLNKVNIKYGSRTILRELDWEVKKGEKWALWGKNGSGKSTLLSLVCGDNPQAYANDIVLFDKKRGTGESIWDIKKQIGYISPEMHLYYLKDIACVDVVGSGLFDTIGLYRKCNEEQLEQAHLWMKIFKIEYLYQSSFLKISTGEQRLVLLARTFIKSPNLIILDEPMHGLDVERKKQLKSIIEKFCDESKTIIYVTHYQEEIPNIVNNKIELIKQ